MEIRTRQAEEKDLPQILVLFTETVQEICSKDYTPEQVKVWVQSAQNPTRWLHAIEHHYFMVAENEAEIVGFASLDAAYINFMYVHKNYQGKGIASLLLEGIIRKAISEGRTTLSSDVSITARSFFEGKGFISVRQNLKELQSILLTNFTMRCSLT